MSIREIDGHKIQDAKQSIILQILAKDVKSATLKNPSSCVIARTCKRQLHAEARIHLSRIYIRKGRGPWVRYIVPKALRSEIIAFDRGGKIIPGTFEITPPVGMQKLGAKKLHTPHKETGNKPRRKPTYTKDIRVGPGG